MSLAITEKRPQQRSGGCVGIFVQLFDWNRRLAKKKLFSKKFLPPARPSKAPPKRFNGNDKMPVANKLLLIADENRGGFPAAKKTEADGHCSSADDPSNGMRIPNLVARLMGLESMPVVNHEKPRKALGSGNLDDRNRGCDYHRLDQDLCQEMGGQGKPDSRPRKVQKTAGFLERQPGGAARFSPEILSKSMLCRTKRQRHKLPSPVGSPRLHSRSSTARLMLAATKILDPGGQSQDRARRALTYTAPLRENADRLDDKTTFSLKEPLSDSLVRSCGSYDSLVDFSKFRLSTRKPLIMEYEPSTSDYSNAVNASSSHDGSLEGKMKTPVKPNSKNSASHAIQAKLNVPGRAQDSTGRKCYAQIDHDQCKPWRSTTLKPTFIKNNSRDNQRLIVRDRVVHEFRACSRKQSGRNPNDLNGSKGFVTSNRNMNGCMRTRSGAKVATNVKVEAGSSGWEKNIVHKRRPIGVPQIRNGGAGNCISTKQSGIGSNSNNRKGREIISSRFINRNNVSSELQKKLNGDRSSVSKDNGIVSFTFSSPMRHGHRSLTQQETKEKSRVPGEFSRDASNSKKLVMDAQSNNLSSQRGIALRGDKLSNLLQETTKELTSSNQEELVMGNAVPVTSTAFILEDLISALTTEVSIPQTNGNSCSGEPTSTENACLVSRDLSDFSISHNQMPVVNKKYEEEAKAGIPAAFQANDSGDQPSPVSILEASFSNDSCSLGSPSCSSGRKSRLMLTETCDRKLNLDLDTDLLDSATSANIREFDMARISHSMDKKFSMHSNQLCDGEISETKLSHATEDISNAEMLFGNISLYESDGTLEPSTDLFLLRLLEAVADAFWISPKWRFGFAKEEKHLKKFLFDCIIECLNSKYDHFCKSGYKAWLKLLVFLSRDQLLREVPEEIRGWGDLIGKSVDDLIEKEISLSTAQWMEFEIEAFESGIKIENDILQALVDEMVIDLHSC